MDVGKACRWSDVYSSVFTGHHGEFPWNLVPRVITPTFGFLFELDILQSTFASVGVILVICGYLYRRFVFTSPQQSNIY